MAEKNLNNRVLTLERKVDIIEKQLKKETSDSQQLNTVNNAQMETKFGPNSTAPQVITSNVRHNDFPPTNKFAEHFSHGGSAHKKTNKRKPKTNKRKSKTNKRKSKTNKRKSKTNKRKSKKNKRRFA